MIICGVPLGADQLETRWWPRCLVIKRSTAMEPHGESLPGCGHIAGLTCTARWVVAG